MAKWVTYWNHAEVATIVVVVNWNFFVVTKFGGGLTNSWCDLGGIRFFSKGNEGVEAKGGACKLLPPLDGKI